MFDLGAMVMSALIAFAFVSSNVLIRTLTMVKVVLIARTFTVTVDFVMSVVMIVVYAMREDLSKWMMMFLGLFMSVLMVWGLFESMLICVDVSKFVLMFLTFTMAMVMVMMRVRIRLMIRKNF
jgi:hypothetical protein